MRPMLTFVLVTCVAQATWAGDVRATEPAATASDKVPEIDFEELLSRFASAAGISAHFRDERTLSLLRAPLVSHGVLYFIPPDTFYRRVEEPTPSTLLVRGGIALMADREGRRRELRAGKVSVLSAVIDSFRMVLTGSLDEIRETYRVAFTRDASDTTAWRIRFSPLRPPLSEQISEIVFAGQGAALTEIRILEIDGDRTVTQLTEVEADRHFSDAEIQELLRFPEP